MKRYRAITWLTNMTIPFIYKGKPYCIRLNHGRGIYSGQVEPLHCNWWYRVNRKNSHVDIDWQKVKGSDDIKNDPEGIEITWSKTDEALNECVRWLDEQVLTDYSVAEIDDMAASKTMPDIMREDYVENR